MTSRAREESSRSSAHDLHEVELRDRYAKMFVDWIEGNEKPGVLNGQENNVVIVERSQTNICTDIASSHYNANNVEFLTKVVGIDSNYFFMKWVDPENSKDKCFHLNFSARVAGCKRTFFAELVGPGYPGLVVRSCVECGPADAMHNCEYCSGLWHPLLGGFHGHQVVKRGRKRPAQL